ncbi:MAG TPA: hypothetical protein VJS18_22100, partial [Paraburkholderia sp.]|nr:hypothetical protein [Paraburkholderia sp.]
MKFRQFVLTSAALACAWQTAHAAAVATAVATAVAADSATDTANALPAQAQQQTSDDTTLPNILVVGDTQHLPQSFDQRYASTQVLTRTDLERVSPADPSIAQALATLPGVTVSQT